MVSESGPINALIAECNALSDRRELPPDVVEAIASALADAIVAELRAEQHARDEVSEPS